MVSATSAVLLVGAAAVGTANANLMHPRAKYEHEVRKRRRDHYHMLHKMPTSLTPTHAWTTLLKISLGYASQREVVKLASWLNIKGTNRKDDTNLLRSSWGKKIKFPTTSFNIWI